MVRHLSARNKGDDQVDQAVSCSMLKNSGEGAYVLEIARRSGPST